MEEIKDYCVIDIETTGLSKYRDKIIEIGCIKVKNHMIVDEMNVLINPHCKIPPFITHLNGITNKMVKDGIEIDEALLQLYDFVGNDVFVGHNIAFDIGFITQKSKECLGLVFNNQTIDTMRIARQKVICDNYKLATLCNYYHIVNESAHRALSDVLATYELYKKLINK